MSNRLSILNTMRNNQKLWKYGAYVRNDNIIDEGIDKVFVISNDSKYAIREEIYKYANKYFMDGILTIPMDHLYNNLVRKFRGPLNRNSELETDLELDIVLLTVIKSPVLNSCSG